MKLTASTFSFNLAFKNQRLDVIGYLDKCVELGFDGVELNDGYVEHCKYSFEEIKLGVIRRGLDVAAIAIESVFVQNSEAEILKEREKIEKWLGIASYFGSPILRVNTGQPFHTLDKLTNKSVTMELVTEWAIKAFQEIMPLARKYGIILAMENHYAATRTSVDTLRMVERVNSPFFKINIDTGNFYDSILYGADFRDGKLLRAAVPFEDVYEGIERMAPHTVYCHAKVYRTHETMLKCPLDYDRIIDVFRKHGYQGYLSIENLSQEDPLEIVPAAARMFRAKMS